jgi:hypothetical protein
MDSAGAEPPEAARQRADDAEVRAAAAEAELLVVTNELLAAQQAQREWDNLMDRLAAERAVEQATMLATVADLDAIRSSRTWRVSWLLLSPYRKLRSLRVR